MIGQVRPAIPLVSTWQEVAFTQPIVGWHELAAYVASKTPLPHRSPNCLRLAFWAGGIPLRAVRYGQRIVFDGVCQCLDQTWRASAKAGP